MSELVEVITPAISDRICKHMNDDHADAVLLYAKIYGNQPEATAATMVAIDPHGMTLSTQLATTQQEVRVEFDHELSGAEDAHHTLVAMLRQAKHD